MMAFLRAVALFAFLTAIMTWPQAARLATEASDHQDVFFNMWRFAWVSHALSSSPSRLFDGNIFYPERRTLTCSDAMLVEAVAAAPLLWARVPPVLVHNVMLLAGIVLSAAGTFVLARRLTGSAGAATTAGVVFAFAPYRFEHYMHMELQWTVWVPWAFWALDRAIETGARRYGALAGVFVALQFMSSIYYGVFLSTLLGLSAVLRLLSLREQALARAAASLAVGGLVAAALCAPYAAAYRATRQQVGTRPIDEIVSYSARPSSYLIATEHNYLYGKASAARGRPERRLFPGILPVLLACAGLFLGRPSITAIVHLLALAAAFEMSLGLYGYSYTFLHQHVAIFDSLRAPARLGIFVVFFLAILAAFGHSAIEGALPRRGRTILAGLVCASLMAEYWVAPLPLQRYPNTPPPLYAWLAKQPRGLVAEFPMPAPDTLPGDEARYGYMSTFHWMPMVNGYSGYYPRSYLDRLTALRLFPDSSSTETLRKEGVEYVLVHVGSYSPDQAAILLAGLSNNPDYGEVARLDDGRAEALVLRLR